MGTPLTGLEIRDTYDALLKITDNGPLSGTLKALSDGLGNDSTLSLSTTAASIAGTLAVTGNATFDTNTLFVDAASNEVGIGTTNPSEKLDLQGTMNMNAVGGTYLQVQYNGANRGYVGTANAIISGGATTDFGLLASSNLLFGTGGSSLERMRIDATGNVGIGTSSPNSKLEVAAGTTIYPINITSSSDIATTTGISMGSFSGLAGGSNGSVYIASAHNHGATAQSSMVFYTHTGSSLTEKVRILAGGGLTFNGDTAAANALDDYEEGTWTIGIAFGGASAGVVYAGNSGTYTKIGRQVTVNGRLDLASKGSSTGAATITGLPFTVANTSGNWSSASVRFNNISFADQLQTFAVINSTTISFTNTTNAGASTDLTEANFANNTDVMFSLTYFV